MSLKEKPLQKITINDNTLLGPVLAGIVSNFIFFRDKFWEYGNNWTQEAILNNKKFIIKRGEPNIFDEGFFVNYLPELDNTKKNELKWSDLIDDKYQMLSRTELNNKLGFNVNFRAYVRFKSGLVNARRKYFKVNSGTGAIYDESKDRI
jgi:hypothetical protein